MGLRYVTCRRNTLCARFERANIADQRLFRDKDLEILRYTKDHRLQEGPACRLPLIFLP
jgi:hypothetical protein